ncbi:peptidoglycan editing factor PgeF [Methylomicrobium lacus]|uniref:peptidoglycan editing factor PgeF n=1 Tax=Methylomicrobium lacus TaxID=136992 RepID=UPI0035A915E3
MSGAESFLFPDWPAPNGVQAAMTLRAGGVSVGPYRSLNPALHVGDDFETVMRNRKLIRESLALPSEPVWLEQVHGNQVVKAEAASMPPQADASYTDAPGVVCVVMTADCLPLLLCSADGRRVAAIHAGWRGLLAGVIGNTVAAMGESEPLVWLGPAIGPDAFEVGEEVRAAFMQKSPAFGEAFRPQADGKWLADIYRLARIDLNVLGVTKIYGGRFCTVTDVERFYSYRRDTVTGRMATLIWRD